MPAALDRGQFHWSMVATPGEARIIGRAEIVSRSGQVASSYSCTSCCPDSGPYSHFDPNAYALNVNGFAFTNGAGDYHDCYNNHYFGSFSWSSMWTSNTSIATVTGSAGQLNGIDVGNTSVAIQYQFFEWYLSQGDCYWYQGSAGDSASVAVAPRISSISPSRGPVGTTVSVLIFGYGFNPYSTPTVSISGYGVTASEVSVLQDGGTITANFNITSDATAGNHAVTVTSNGFTSNGVDFFVQFPVSFSAVSLSRASDTCDTGSSGVYGQVLYQVLDQQGEPANAAGWTPQEHLTINGTSAFPGFRPFATPQSTVSNGRFLDTPVGSCFGPPPPPTNICVDVVQTFNIVVGSITYNIGTTTTRRDCAQGIRVSVTNGGTTQSATLGTVN